MIFPLANALPQFEALRHSSELLYSKESRHYSKNGDYEREMPSLLVIFHHKRVQSGVSYHYNLRLLIWQASASCEVGVYLRSREV